MAEIMVRVQSETFDTGVEMARFMDGPDDIGAVASFAGLVRGRNNAGQSDTADARAVTAMTLEHYPGMTEKSLMEIAQQASTRWPELRRTLIIHRFGRMLVGEPIVLVLAASPHRDVAFDACRFLMDWLKTKAPFWKLEETGQGANWVDARDSDDAATARWSAPCSTTTGG